MVSKLIKKHKLITLSILLGIIFFIVAIFSFDIEKVISNFEKISVFKFLIYFLVANLTFVISVCRWRVVLKSYSISVNFYKIYLWRLAGWTGNYITPSAYIGGEPIRAMFICKETGLEFKPALANVVADSFLNIFTEVILTCLAGLFAILHFSSVLRFEESFIIAVILISLAIYFLYWRISRGKFIIYPTLKFLKINSWKPKFTAEIKEFEELFIDFFKNKKTALKKGFSLSILMYLSSLAEFWVLAFFMGVNLSFWQIILLKIFIVLGYILPIPAGLGSAEISLAKFFEIFGYGPSIGVAYNLLIRLKDSLLAIFGLIVLSTYGIGFLKPAFSLFIKFVQDNLKKLTAIDLNNKKR